MDMERLDRVLRRVRGEEPAQDNRKDRETLSRLIRGEEQSRDNYGWLRNRCGGRARVLLTQLWIEEDRHCRDLQAEYLARYGKWLPAEKMSGPAGTRGVLSALGQIREKEEAAAEEYRRCSRETRDHRLCLLYEKLASEEMNHAQRLTELIRQAMKKS